MLVAFSATSQAAVVIDPSIGFNGQFSWDDGLGQIDAIAGDSAQTEWSITVLNDSVLSSISVFDEFIPGDEFALIFDGGGFFNASLNNLFLSSGTHTFTLDVTTLAATFIDGAATATFSTVSPVPVPAAAWLFGSALLGFFGMRRKATKVSV